MDPAAKAGHSPGMVRTKALFAIGPPPRLTPQEMVSDALDAVQAHANEEIFAGGFTRGAHQAFTADPGTFQAKMLTRLPISA
jgi:hypothetical protein